MRGAVTAVALVLLVESLVGNTWTVLGSGLVLAIAAGKRIGHPVLLAACAAALFVNTFLLPVVVLPEASASVTWAWLPLWCLEGLLISWLLVGFLGEPDHRGSAPDTLGTSQEITQAEQRSAQLLIESSSQSQEQFRLMVESIGDYAIVMLRPDGRIASWNVGAERILGYRAGEVLGRNHALFFLAEDMAREIPRRSLEAAAAEGKCETEGWRRRKDHSRLWAQVGFTPMRSASGSFWGSRRSSATSPRSGVPRNRFVRLAMS